jgi:hypothetical protein
MAAGSRPASGSNRCRIQILNSFLSTPHGKLADLAPLHLRALEGDPLFYGHLAAW